jgi:hypothetical protein
MQKGDNSMRSRFKNRRFRISTNFWVTYIF